MEFTEDGKMGHTRITDVRTIDGVIYVPVCRVDEIPMGKSLLFTEELWVTLDEAQDEQDIQK